MIPMCVLCQQLRVRERGVVVHTGALADATHSLTARASDTAGNTSDGDRLLADGRLPPQGKVLFPVLNRSRSSAMRDGVSLQDRARLRRTRC